MEYRFSKESFCSSGGERNEFCFPATSSSSVSGTTTSGITVTTTGSSLPAGSIAAIVIVGFLLAFTAGIVFYRRKTKAAMDDDANHSTAVELTSSEYSNVQAALPFVIAENGDLTEIAPSSSDPLNIKGKLFN